MYKKKFRNLFVLIVFFVVVTGVSFTPVTTFAEEETSEIVKLSEDNSYEEVVGVTYETDYNGFSYEKMANGSYSVVKYNGNSSYLSIPDSFNGISVSSIADGFAENNSSIQTVIIPYGIKSIGNNAFKNCSNLSSITITDTYQEMFIQDLRKTSLVSIGDYAFYGTALSDVNLMAKGLSSIGDYAFGECKSLRKIQLPDSLTYIGKDAFLNCTRLEQMDFLGTENAWINIEYGANTSGTHPNYYATTNRFCNIVKVWGGAEYNYYELSSLKLQDYYYDIDAYEFFNFNQLTTVEISGPSEIGVYAFGKCTRLTSLTVHNSVEIVGRNAFYACDSLRYGKTYVHQNSFAHTALNNQNNDGGVKFNFEFLPEDGCSGGNGGGNNPGGEIGGDIPGGEVIITDAESAYTFEGYSATFDGTLGLKFYYSLNVSLSDYPDALVQFEIPDGNNGYIQKTIKFSELKPENNKYVFRVDLLPKEADTEIKFCFYLNSGNHASIRTTTFYDYLKRVVDKCEQSSQVQNKYVAMALITYCNAAQRYFGYHYGNVDLSNYLYSEAEISKGDNIGYITYNPIIMDNDYIGCNLVLEDKVSFKLYFRGQKSFSEFTEANGIYTEYVNGITIFTIKDIKFGLSASLGSMHTMSETITVQNPSSYISISVYSYIRLACNSGNSDLAYLANSIYKLDSTCKTYKVTYDLQNP